MSDDGVVRDPGVVVPAVMAMREMFERGGMPVVDGFDAAPTETSAGRAVLVQLSGSSVSGRWVSVMVFPEAAMRDLLSGLPAVLAAFDDGSPWVTLPKRGHG